MQVPIALYPQLKFLCWSRPGDVVVDGADALALYESGWRHVDEAALTPDERALLGEFVARYGAGVLLVRGPRPGVPATALETAPATPGATDERTHQRRLAKLLAALDADLLRQAECFLGGGTAVVLSLGGYREVGGVRLFCASPDGYRLLRARLHEPAHGPGAAALLRVPSSLRVLRDLRADQHGLSATSARRSRSTGTPSGSRSSARRAWVWRARQTQS